MKSFTLAIHFVFVGLLVIIAVSAIQECFIQNAYGSFQSIFALLYFAFFSFVLIVYTMITWALKLQTN